MLLWVDLWIFRNQLTAAGTLKLTKSFSLSSVIIPKLGFDPNRFYNDNILIERIAQFSTET